MGRLNSYRIWLRREPRYVSIQRKAQRQIFVFFDYNRTCTSGDAIHVVDRDLRILLFNTAFEQWRRDLGLETKTVGRMVFEVFPFLPPQVRDEYHQVLKTGRTVLTTDVPVCIDGRELFTETRKIPVFRGGQVIYCVTVVRDITAQQRAEEELRRYAHRIETLREIERAVLAAQSPAAIAQAALLRVRLLVPCRWASVAILAERGEEEVVTSLGGTVKLESELGQGSTFTVALDVGSA